MNQDSKRTCTAIVLLIKPFVWYRTRRRRGLYSCKIPSRELKQRRRRGQRLLKNEFIFYKRNSLLSRSVRYANGFKNVLQLHMQRRR